MDEIYRQIQKISSFLRQQANRTQSLRMSNPEIHVPESILGVKRSAETIFGDAASTIAATEFDFDDVIVNSKAYRRAMAMAQGVVSKGDKPELADLEKASNSPETVDSPKPKISNLHPSMAMCIEIDRPELGFKRPFNRAQPQIVCLRNPNSGPVMFKVLTTTPKQYTARPNWGRIEAGKEFQVLITKLPMDKDPPLNEKFKDKFRFQSFSVAADEQLDSFALVSARIESLLSSPPTKYFVQDKKMPIAFLPLDDAATTPGWF